MTQKKVTIDAEIDQIIILRGLSKSKATIMPVFDPQSQWYHGVDRVAPNKVGDKVNYIDPATTRLELEDGLRLDLSTDYGRITWKWAQFSPVIAQSYDDALKSRTAYFYVYQEGKEARMRNSIKDLKFTAQKYIREDSPINYEDRALILGVDMVGESPEIIKDFLTDMAETHPQKIINIYESKSTQIRLTYIKAKKKNIITEKDNVYQYGKILLGTSDEGALAFLLAVENKDILEELNKQVNPELYGLTPIKD